MQCLCGATASPGPSTVKSGALAGHVKRAGLLATNGGRGPDTWTHAPRICESLEASVISRSFESKSTGEPLLFLLDIAVAHARLICIALCAPAALRACHLHSSRNQGSSNWRERARASATAAHVATGGRRSSSPLWQLPVRQRSPCLH
jgi:hypothetical protein